MDKKDSAPPACRMLRPLLAEFIRGGLDDDAETHGRVRGHLVVCDDCAEEAAEILEAVGVTETVSRPLPTPVRHSFSTRRTDLGGRVEEALKRALDMESRTEIQHRLGRWLRVFGGKCEGAVRFLDKTAGLAVEGLGEVLRTDVHWRFGYSGYAPQDLQPLARIGGQLGARRLVKGIRTERGAVTGGAAEVSLEGDQLSVTIEGLPSGPPPVILHCSLGGRVQVQECVPVITEAGKRVFRAELKGLAPDDLVLIEPATGTESDSSSSTSE